MSTTYPIWTTSWRCPTPGNLAIGVVERLVTKNDDSSYSYGDRLVIHKDPIRPFWITYPQFQTYQYKKEFEDIAKCQKYECKESELLEKITMALGYNYTRFRTLRQACGSPYVYGADIDIETIIRQQYRDKETPGIPLTFTRGGLDIENELTGQKRINVLTFIHEHTIYTAALKEYCRIHLGDDKFQDATTEDVVAKIHDMLGYYFTEHKFTLEFKMCDTEVELIAWIFSKIHANKTNFIGIWNIEYDIPYILDRLKVNNVSAEDIMCHPDVPKQYRYVNFKKDTSDVGHITDKWHWTVISGYSQFIDSMCLYGRLRKVKGRDSSYNLDDIATKELGHGKLHFGNITNHIYEQKYHFLEYIAYNINDVLIMQLMEFKTNDLISLHALTGLSPLNYFSRQTAMLRNDAYHYGLSIGKLPSSSGDNMTTEYDGQQVKAGGTVLPPNKAIGTRTSVVKEYDRETLVSLFSNDLDAASMYPTVTSAFNISKETAKSTVIRIHGYPQEAVESYFSGIVNPDVSAISLCTTFLGLPGYTEIEKILT